jgi:hypothetical protein
MDSLADYWRTISRMDSLKAKDRVFTAESPAQRVLFPAPDRAMKAYPHPEKPPR